MTRMGIPHVGRGVMASLLAVAATSFAVLGFAAPALAKPTGEFANFGECPLSNKAVNQCIFAQTTSGQFSIGSTEVPITKTITLQGGLIFVEEPRSETFVDAKIPANTLSKTPQTVPGGLFKIVASKGWPEILQIIFNEFINKGITGVTETTELAGTPSLNRLNLLFGEGTALNLPSRVHLENPFLGNNCYIGSSKHPVTVELTTGTTSPPEPNLPIKGAVGEVEAKHEGELIIIKKNSLVNNTFSAPEAEGCGEQILFGIFTGAIDSAVDSELGLPSASGHNTAILNGNLENATATAVKASE
jgi:hypothetical protein